MFLMSDSGDDLEEARKKFQEEITGVQNLRMTITSALERLRLESDTLQREQAALRAYEERVVTSFERLKEKEATYKEKGK
jgi:FtsZ-binding cell division protein ZapB